MGTSFPDCGNKLFHAIQEPVLVVTPDGIIIDVNNTALTAAKKTASEIIEKGICNIIHGGSSPHIKCPLEEFLKACSSRTEETTLPGLSGLSGLSGEYLLTISPVKNLNGEKNTFYRKRTDKR